MGHLSRILGGDRNTEWITKRWVSLALYPSCILEGQRSKLRRALFARQDEVEAQRNDLIEKLESQLGQRVQEQTLFTVEWELT